MVFPSITVQTEGGRPFQAKLQVSAEVLGDLSEMFDEVVHPWMINHVRTQFETSGRHGGAAWEGYGNEPKYKAFKRRVVGRLELLRWAPDEGKERLYPSLVNTGHPDHVWQRDNHSARFGTSVPYASDLEEGGVGPFDERYPGRPILTFKKSQIVDASSKIGAGRDTLVGQMQVWIQTNRDLRASRVVR